MYALPVLVSLLVVVAASAEALRRFHRMANWEERRFLLLLVLAAPAVSLGVGFVGVVQVIARICFLGVPSSGYLFTIAGPVLMGLVTLGAVGLGVLRAGLLSWTVARRCVIADPDLQALADRLADHLGARRPRVRLTLSNHPVALTWGVRRPTVLLSTWMLDALDVRELEAVLAHELGHTVRHDYPVLWLATVLRDAFFYLPTSRRAYRRLQCDKELACDGLAVSVTNRPLALASALAKIWHQAVGGPALGAAQAFTEAEHWIEQRIEWLVGAPRPALAAAAGPSVRAGAFGVGASVLIGLMTVQAIALIVILLSPMACSPTALLGHAL